MNEEKNQKVLAIVLVLAVIILCVYKVFFAGNKKREAKIDTETISIVKDVNDFYTVASCVGKYFVCLGSNDTDSILALLDTNYKKENNIDANNLYTKVESLNGLYLFNARKMYVQRMSANTYKYYVYGYKQMAQEDTAAINEDYYIIVTLDKENTTFSVEPYDGAIFNK